MGLSAGIVKSICLQLISGSPLKNASSHVSEGLKVMQKLSGGLGGSIPGIGDISNLSNVIKNPVAGLVSQAQSSITSAVASLGSYPTLATTLSGAVPHLTDLGSLTDKLSGAVIPDAGDFGIHDAIQLAQNASSGASLSSLTAAVTDHTAINALLTHITTLPQQVIAGTITESAAVSALTGSIGGVQGLVSNTTSAFTTAAATMTNDNHLNQMFNHLADANAPAEVKSLITSVIQPSKLSAIQNAVQTQITNISNGNG